MRPELDQVKEDILTKYMLEVSHTKIKKKLELKADMPDDVRQELEI